MFIWHRMHFLSIFSNSNRTRQANELTMKSPSQRLYLPCYSSSSVYTGLFLLQSKLWGYGRKIRCNEQEPLHLLAKRTLKVLKNEKLGQRTIQAQSIAFEFNVLKVPSDSDALCLMLFTHISLTSFMMTPWLRKTIHYNARWNGSYLFSLYKKDSWEITCSKEGKRQSNVAGSR